MPMDFPDIDSLSQRATQRGFRQPNEGESEQEYRHNFADYMQPIDFVESSEIRNKVGWDKFSKRQQLNMLERKVGSGQLVRLLTELQK